MSTPGGVEVHCVICLNLDNTVLVPATAVIHGYSVCNEHTVLMEHQDFNFLAYVEAARKQKKAL